MKKTNLTEISSLKAPTCLILILFILLYAALCTFKENIAVDSDFIASNFETRFRVKNSASGHIMRALSIQGDYFSAPVPGILSEIAPGFEAVYYITTNFKSGSVVYGVINEAGGLAGFVNCQFYNGNGFALIRRVTTTGSVRSFVLEARNTAEISVYTI